MVRAPRRRRRGGRRRVALSSPGNSGAFISRRGLVEPLLSAVQVLREEAVRALRAAATGAALEDVRRTYLSRQGKVSRLLRGLKDRPLAERRAIGPAAQALRAELERAYASARDGLTGPAPVFDLSLPGCAPPVGHLHPLTIVRRDIEDVFVSMGFTVLDAPDVEEARYNFDLLNMPADHPARDLHDTFWLADGRLLRTHTSAAQVRVMRDRVPPYRLLIPGRVFRHEATDATHESTFYQFEGMLVDEGVSLAQLKGVLQAAIPRIVQREVALRFRPSYFPFVEPGVEVDMACSREENSHRKCPVCKGTSWVEICGAGMIHPVVLHNAGTDARRYQGFAFGGSIDRLAMLRYDIPDIRLFWSGNPHFLEQF